MLLEAEIHSLRYKKVLKSNLQSIRWGNQNINLLPSVFLLNYKGVKLAISKWVSPKRTRSYPYAKVYDTLRKDVAKTIAIIPIVKDEGKKGDRDFLQWDTVALMSLLGVYVIPAYYCSANKSNREGKITDQKFDNDYIIAKLEEILDYRSSALHWNMKEFSKENCNLLMKKVITCYRKISSKLNVPLHSEKGLFDYMNRCQKSLEWFIQTSRIKAKKAQIRESNTLQPKEYLTGKGLKASLTITNFLGGEYHFTVDEVVFKVPNSVYLIESKHTSRGLLPSANDIKDGLLKMVLYTNIENLKLDGKPIEFTPVLRLTSKKIKGIYKNESILENRDIKKSNLYEFLKDLIEEAAINNFEVWLEGRND